MNNLRWTDVWILVAAYISHEKSKYNVHNIIAVADTINHAVVNYEEISSAMVRLEEHGLVEVEKIPWRIICTEKAIKLIQPIANKNSLAYRIWKEVEEQLNVSSWVPSEPLPHPDNNLIYPDFTINEYEDEIKCYFLNL